MTVVVTGNTYENGKRVQTQAVTYEKSDDLFALANAQRRYEAVCAQIAALPEGEGVPSYLLETKHALEEEILKTEELLAGYSKMEAEV